MLDEPKPVTPAAPVPSPGQSALAPTPTPSPFNTPLEGEEVPEQFRGKTAKDILNSQMEAAKLMTRATQETAQWRDYALSLSAGPGGTKTEVPEDAAPAFEKPQAEAIASIVGEAMKPVLQMVAQTQLDMAKEIYPDWDDFEARAIEIWNQMPGKARFDPKYGWGFAYRMAKAEKIEPGRRGAAMPPTPGASLTPTIPAKEPLDDEQLKIMKAMGMTEDAYRKFSEPVIGGKQ